MKSEWKTRSLSDVCSKITDGSHFSPPSVDDGEYMVSVKDFTSYGFDFSSSRKISRLDYETLVRNGCTAEYNDVLIGKDGARYLEDIILYRQTERPALLSSIAILKANDEVIPEFLYYRLFDKGFRKQIRENMGSGSAIPRMVLKDFRRIPFSYPPIDDQKRITQVLSCLDNKIANNTKINHHLEQMAQAIFKSWFVDFEPWGGVMPNDWKDGIVKDTCTAIYNGGTPRRNIDSYWGGTIPWLTSGEVRQSIIIKPENFISEAGLTGSSAKWVPSLSTVVALYGATAGQVSLTATPLTTNQAICSLIPKENYTYYNYLLMRNAVSQLKNKAIGSAQQNISKAIVEETTCLIVDKNTIAEFDNLVSPLFNVWINNLFESSRLAALRDSLLPRLMSGELSVADLDAAK